MMVALARCSSRGIAIAVMMAAALFPIHLMPRTGLAACVALRLNQKSDYDGSFTNTRTHRKSSIRAAAADGTLTTRPQITISRFDWPN
jgi:hypothetical protein